MIPEGSKVEYRGRTMFRSGGRDQDDVSVRDHTMTITIPESWFEEQGMGWGFMAFDSERAVFTRDDMDLAAALLIGALTTGVEPPVPEQNITDIGFLIESTKLTAVWGDTSALHTEPSARVGVLGPGLKIIDPAEYQAVN